MAYLQGITPSDGVKVMQPPVASENLTYNQDRCKIGGKLLLITNRKSRMGFRLITKLATLNGVMDRNRRVYWSAIINGQSVRLSLPELQ